MTGPAGDGEGFRTVGQTAAVAAVRAMLATHVPHALLLAGPPSVGKVSLALDLAAALLCTGADGDRRPCRACRGCRMVEHGNHPDLHRLEPDGPGGQIRIGDRLHPEPGTVRGLAVELTLLPVEGGARVAIIRDAHRMNDDAQSALLKTLEEPPPGTTLVLCADDEERLLPTVRSRCARVRLGTVGPRDVERLLASRELADPPTAARLARLVGGRPGLAFAYAAVPEAEGIRGELTRALLDLLDAGRADRLRAARDLMGRAGTLTALLAAPEPAPELPARRARTRGASPASASQEGAATAGLIGATGGSAVATSAAEPGTAPDEEGIDAQPGRRVPAAERRRALAVVLEVWRDLARDLAVAQLGDAPAVRDLALLEELVAVASRAPHGAFPDMLRSLARAGDLLDGNVSPEILLDVLLLRWPRLRAAT